MLGEDSKAHVTVRLDADQERRLRLLAKQNERSLSAELRVAIRKYLQDAEKAA